MNKKQESGRRLAGWKEMMMCEASGKEIKKECESEATSCTLVERDSSQVNQLRGAERQKEDEKH